jgi:hypothetical protein
VCATFEAGTTAASDRFPVRMPNWLTVVL